MKSRKFLMMLLAVAALVVVPYDVAFAITMCHGQDCAYTSHNRHRLVICDTERDTIQAEGKGRSESGRVYTIKDRGGAAASCYYGNPPGNVQFVAVKVCEKSNCTVWRGR